MVGEPHKTAWEKWQIGWHDQANALQWALRNFMHWTPVPFNEQGEAKSDFIHFSPEVRQRAEALSSRYEIQALPRQIAYQRLLENLTYLDWLDIMAESTPEWFSGLLASTQSNEAEQTEDRPDSQSPIRWLDVGAKNWAYVNALAAFSQQHFGPNFQLDGVELDPHRRYSNFQTRGQAARAFIEPLPQARYHAGNALYWRQPANVISMFLPFVFEDPHMAWGLPLSYFQPKELLKHLVSLLPAGGLLIVVNQGEEEALAQESLLREVQAAGLLEIKSLGQLPARFIEYRYPRLGWLCRKVH